MAETSRLVGQAKILDAIEDHFQFTKEEVKMKAIGGSVLQSSQ